MRMPRLDRAGAGRAIGRLLVVVQLIAAGAGPLADVQEPETAPAAFEAHHDATCIVLHDAMRCAICQYAASLTAPPRAIGFRTREAVYRLAARPNTPLEHEQRTATAARPRAPPLSSAFLL